METEPTPKPVDKADSAVAPTEDPGEVAAPGRALRIGAFSLLGVVLLVALALCGLIVWQSVRPRGTPQPSVPPAPLHGHLDNQVFGAEQAKVKVIAALPLRTGCQAERVEYLFKAAKACPDRLQVRFVDLKQPQGQEALKKYGLHCASVIVNSVRHATGAAGRRRIYPRGSASHPAGGASGRLRGSGACVASRGVAGTRSVGDGEMARDVRRPVSPARVPLFVEIPIVVPHRSGA